MRQIKPGVSVEIASDSGQAVVAKGLARLGLIESANATIDPPELLKAAVIRCCRCKRSLSLSMAEEWSWAC